MIVNRKMTVVGVLTAIVTISVAAIRPQHDQSEFKNLRVLPKDISKKALQQIMVDEFQDGLGVGCNYCHAQEKGSLHLDYASDEKPEKEIARSMIQMTMDINGKYFGIKEGLIGDSSMAVTCSSCHHGTSHPDKTN